MSGFEFKDEMGNILATEFFVEDQNKLVISAAFKLVRNDLTKLIEADIDLEKKITRAQITNELELCNKLIEAIEQYKEVFYKSLRFNYESK